jgi:hypothetical protein
METRDYIASELFIHDDLLFKAEAAVNKLYEIWKNEGRIEPSLLTWPAEPVPSERGEPITNVCCLQLPERFEERATAIRLMVERTKAYGLFLVEQQEDNVRALLETPHGTRCWNIPIHRSGDVNVLGHPVVTNNRENVGLLWAPRRGSA